MKIFESQKENIQNQNIKNFQKSFEDKQNNIFNLKNPQIQLQSTKKEAYKTLENSEFVNTNTIKIKQL